MICYGRHRSKHTTILTSVARTTRSPRSLITLTIIRPSTQLHTLLLDVQEIDVRSTSVGPQIYSAGMNVANNEIDALDFGLLEQ